MGHPLPVADSRDGETPASCGFWPPFEPETAATYLPAQVTLLAPRETRP